MKISQRERVLLLFAGLLFVVILPFFLIVKPMIEVSKGKLDEFDLVSEQAILMEIEINSLDVIKAEHEKMTKELESYRQDIPAKEKSYNIHYQLTDLCEGAGLAVESLNIGTYNVVKHEVKNEETGATTMEDTPIYESIVSIKVKGSLAQMLDLAQAIDNRGKYMILTDFTVNNINTDEVLTGELGIKFYAVSSEVETSQK